MTVNSDIGCSYISEQWRKTISLGAYKLKLVMTLSELLRRLVFHNKSTEAILIYVLSFIICILFQLSSGEIVLLVVEWNNVDSRSGYTHV